MLRANTGVIETGGNAVRRLHLTIGVLQEVAQASMKNTRPARSQRGRMSLARHPFAGRFDTDELDALVLQEGGEDADRIRATAHAGNHGTRQPAVFLQQLRSGLASDHRLEVPDQTGKWIGTDH